MNVKIDGDFGKARKDPNDNIANFIARTTALVHGSAVKLAPVDTGNLRNGIVFEMTRDSGTITSKAEYSFNVEFGTKPHKIKAKNAQTLSDGKNFFGKEVNHPGTKAQPFMRPALDSNRPEIRRLGREYLKDTIKGK